MKLARSHVLTMLALAIAALGTAAIVMRSAGDPATDRSASVAQPSSTVIATLVEGAATSEFEPLRGDWTLSLPRDHGAHPEARTETWSVTAHLAAATGEAIDLSLSFSRYGILPPDAAAQMSPWTVSSLYAGQLLVFDGRDGTGHADHRFSRGAGAAGHDPEAREIWLDEWRIVYGGGPGNEGLRVRASGVDVLIDLLLEPGKPALAASGEATATTRGFSMPRLAVSGVVQTAAGDLAVSGTAWLDRLWGDVPPPGGPIAYDRLTLHLSNGTDMSIVQTRRVGREGAATLDGVVVDDAGRASYLADDTLHIEVLERRPVAGGASYPVSWQVRGDGFDLTATALTLDARQEFLAPMWLGPVAVVGQVEGADVQGRGMLLLTGYEDRP